MLEPWGATENDSESVASVTLTILCNRCVQPMLCNHNHYFQKFSGRILLIRNNRDFPIWLGFILTSSDVFFQLIHGAHMNIKILLEQVRVAIGTLPRDLVSVRVFPCKLIFLY